MEIIKTWAINKMDVYPQVEGETNVVSNIYWTLSATDKTFSGFMCGAQNITIDENGSFTPYEELTEEQVLSWVHDAMGADMVSHFENVVVKQIEDQINPPVVTLPPPWVN